MDGKIFLVYNHRYLNELEEKYRVNETMMILPEICFTNRVLMSYEIFFIKNQLKKYFEWKKKVLAVVYYNKGQGFVIIWRVKNLKEITLIFDYAKYNDYFPIIKKLNDLVSKDGMIDVFVDNIIYHLEFGVCIHTSKNYEDILRVANENNIKIDFSRGFDEILDGQLLGKQYNSITLLPDMSLERIISLIQPLIIHDTLSTYKNNGFREINQRRGKLFVSYSHKNISEVRKIIDELRAYGLDFWVDEEQIDVGDRIMERVRTGVNECDLPILFISEYSKKSPFAKHELLSFLSTSIYESSENKPWFIVRLDNVNPNEIAFGLGDFKYFDMQSGTIASLLQQIQKKMNK